MWDKQSDAIRYHTWFGPPLARDVQLGLTRAYAQFLAWADHVGLRVQKAKGRPRRIRKSKKRADPYLSLAGLDADECTDVIEPLKKLHYLRSKVKGHAAGGRDKLIKAARTEHGSLSKHFRDLATSLWRSFDRITELL